MLFLAVFFEIYGLYLLVTSSGPDTFMSKFKLTAGLAMIFVMGPALYACQKLGESHYREIIVAAAGIIGGVTLVW
jgi:hypothetical protein